MNSINYAMRRALKPFSGVVAKENRLYSSLVMLWITWLVVGSIFYTYQLNLGWGKGFYMAVNIGYSIGKKDSILL